MSGDLNVVSLQPNLGRDSKLTTFGKAILRDRYLLQDERPQDLFIRVAKYYGDDEHHSERLYNYISNLWFMPSTPILSNGGTARGLPISCFLNEVQDSLTGIVDTWRENVWLASSGGGIGTYWGDVRSIGEDVGINGRTSGIMPFIKVMDSQTLAISQGSLRRGSAAVYLDISHPEIEEFVDLRRPTGGDHNRRSLNLHHGVVISDKFMDAVEAGAEWELLSPHTKSVVSKVDARALWVKILMTRIETGEPYMLFIDNVTRGLPEIQKKLGLEVKTSNLCSEITLPTGLDHLAKKRTAVCCLSSVNLEFYDEWQGNKLFIKDIMRFLDNVLTDFCKKAPDHMEHAKYAAMRERSVGLGVMGFCSFLQKKMLPIESAMSKVWNKRIFQYISTQATQASLELGEERGPCPDAIDAGSTHRFSNTMAIAPTASISIICGNSSPGVEPYSANSFTQKTLTGSFNVRNRILEKLLIEKGYNTESTWSSIATHEGSVSQLPFLDDYEKEVFKTAYEIDQKWLIDFAADRAPYISQAQSINLFLNCDVDKQDLHDFHFQAWKKGVKSLYYCRSNSIQRAEKVSHKESVAETSQADDECLSCQ